MQSDNDSHFVLQAALDLASLAMCKRLYVEKTDMGILMGFVTLPLGIWLLKCSTAIKLESHHFCCPRPAVAWAACVYIAPWDVDSKSLLFYELINWIERPIPLKVEILTLGNLVVEETATGVPF